MGGFSAIAGGYSGYIPPVGGQVQVNSVPVSFTDSLEQAIPAGPGIGTAPGQCPMLPDGNCVDLFSNASGETGCGNYRECDTYTGHQHLTTVTPAGNTVNGAAAVVNSWAVVNGQMVWLDATGNPGTPPNGASPPVLDNGVFTSNINPNTSAALANLGTVGGMKYNPASGWVPVAGVAPTQTSPTIPAFQSPAGIGPVSNPSSAGNTQNSTATKSAAALPSGNPGTSGVKPAVVRPPADYTGIIIFAAAAFLLLALK